MPKHRTPRRPLPPPPMRPEDEPDDVDLEITRRSWQSVAALRGGPTLTDRDVYEIDLNSKGFIRAFEKLGVFVEPDPDDPDRMRIVQREPKLDDDLG